MDIREEVYNNLKDYIVEKKINGVKFSEPTNGKTIKLNGIVLYKISASNPYRKKGVVIWKHLTDTAIEILGGMRSEDKKKWVACPVTDDNAKTLENMLIGICEKINTKTKGGKLKTAALRKENPREQAKPHSSQVGKRSNGIAKPKKK